MGNEAKRCKSPNAWKAIKIAMRFESHDANGQTQGKRLQSPCDSNRIIGDVVKN